MIHNTAIIEQGAELGENVSVGPFSIIESGASIGANCVIDSHVAIKRYVSMGAGCKVHAGAVLGDDPQDMGFKGCDSYVRIGSGCTIREGVTIHRGTGEGTATEVGNNCFLMAFSHLAHNVVLGNNVIMANGALLAGHVKVGDRAFISGNAVVHQFVRIGKVAMLGGASAASQDVPPFCTIRPSSLNTLVGLNTVGLKRAGCDADELMRIKRAFKRLFLSGLNFTEAIRQVRDEETSDQVLELCRFIEESERGVCSIRKTT